MGKTSGPGSLPYFIESRQSSVKLVGSSGWILPLRKRNGVGKKMRSCFIWRNLCQRSGEPLRQLLAERRPSVWNDMSIFCEENMNIKVLYIFFV